MGILTAATPSYGRKYDFERTSDAAKTLGARSAAAASPFTAEIEARLTEKILGNRRHGLDDIFA
jgi:hypothetical protein